MLLLSHFIPDLRFQPFHIQVQELYVSDWKIAAWGCYQDGRRVKLIAIKGF